MGSSNGATPDKDNDKEGGNDFGRELGSFHTFTDIANKRKKLLSSAVAMNTIAIYVPRWLN